MRIKVLDIKNFCGIQEQSIEPTDITEISGDNGFGKTSFIRAIRAAIGGAEAKLVRNGTDQAEIGIVFDSDIRLDRIIPLIGKSTVKVVHPEFGEIRAKPFLDKLAALATINPVDLLDKRTKPQDRIAWLLEAIARKVTAEDLAGCGVEVTDEIRRKADGEHALVVIEECHSASYARRRDLNRDADKARKTAEKLTSSLPKDDGKDWDAEAQALSEALASIKSQIGTADERTEKAIQDEARAAQLDSDERLASVAGPAKDRIAKLQSEIAEIMEDMNRQALALEQGRRSRIDQTKDRIRAEQTAATAARQEERARIEGELATAKARQTERARAGIVREQIAEADVDARTNGDKAGLLTETLKKLEALKSRLLSGIPIRGLDIKGNDLIIDGVPFDLVNTARQVEFAFDAVCLRMGDLQVVCIDDFEHLSPTHRRELEATARKREVQLFVTRVTEDALTVSMR